MQKANTGTANGKYRGWLSPILTLVMGLLVGGFLVIAAQFEEPEAIETSSLVSLLGAKSVLAVVAHPDDEILISSLLWDGAGRREITVRTITVTHGEAGVGPSPIQHAAQLGAILAAELVQYGRLLGLDEQELWNYPDVGLTGDRINDLERDLVAAIRKWKPDLVVTFEPNTGFTLHPDHLAVGQVTERATRSAADINVMPEVTPPHAPLWIAYVLAPRRMWARFGGDPGQQIAANRPPTDYAIPANRRLKTQGWDIHASQRHVIKELFGVPPWVLYTFWDKEHYAVQERNVN